MSSSPEPNTPVSFDVVRRGFDPEQVTRHIEKLHYDLRIASADQDLVAARVTELMDQLAQEQATSEQLRQQLARIANEPLSATNLPEALQIMVDQARREATTIRAAADVDATQMRQHAAAQASAELAAARQETAAFDAAHAQQQEALSEQQATFFDEQERARAALAADIAAKMADAEAKAAATLDAATTAAQKIRADAQQQADDLIAATQQAQQTESDDFELAISARRTQAHAEVSEMLTTARDEADETLAETQLEATAILAAAATYVKELLSAATDEGQRRLRTADAAVAHSRDVRDNIVQQLANLADHLRNISTDVSDAPEIIAPTAAEKDRPTAADFAMEAHWQAPAIPRSLVDFMDKRSDGTQPADDVSFPPAEQ